MNLIKQLYLKISRSKKTDTEKLTELAEEMVNTICQSVFDGKKLSYTQISVVGSIFIRGIEKYLADSIERHTTETEEALRHHGQMIKEAEKAIQLLTDKSKAA